MNSEKPRTLTNVLDDLDMLISDIGHGALALQNAVPAMIEEIKQWEDGFLVYYISRALELQKTRAEALMEEAHDIDFAIRQRQSEPVTEDAKPSA